MIPQETCVSIFEEKDEAFENSRMKIKCRKQDMQEGKCLRTDNGLECCKDQFDKF